MGELLNNGILTLVTFAPAVGAALLLLFKRENVKAIRAFSLIIAVLTFVLSLHLIAHFDSANSDFQFAVNVPWMPSVGIDYHMGVDGISVFLILLATVLTPLAILASWSVHTRAKEYFMFMLLLETGMIGVFVSLDLFLFYLFWEVMLVPMYFLIGVWGGERRIYAAMKFVLYTMIGGVLMLATLRGISRSAIRRFSKRSRVASSCWNPMWSCCCSRLSSLRSRSKFLCSRSTHGCRTPTLRLRRRDRCCWPASCSRWEPMA
jgi:NADH:ubiquinone oxidoreductase subunit 4 (subunit M)